MIYNNYFCSPENGYGRCRVYENYPWNPKGGGVIPQKRYEQLDFSTCEKRKRGCCWGKTRNGIRKRCMHNLRFGRTNCAEFLVRIGCNETDVDRRPARRSSLLRRGERPESDEKMLKISKHDVVAPTPRFNGRARSRNCLFDPCDIRGICCCCSVVSYTISLPPPTLPAILLRPTGR